jgi:hypothetical protein
MGGREGIANPLPPLRKKHADGSSTAFPEQRIGCGAVGGGLVAMRLHPCDFRFEQRDPLAKFSLRVGAKVLESEAGRCVSDRPGAIGFFHCRRSIRPKRLAVNRRDGYSPAEFG